MEHNSVGLEWDIEHMPQQSLCYIAVKLVHCSEGKEFLDLFVLAICTRFRSLFFSLGCY